MVKKSNKTENQEQVAGQAPEQEQVLDPAQVSDEAEAQVPGSEQVEEENPEQEQVAKAEESAIDPNVKRLMKLYPQYKKLWITKNGFVHPEGVPKWMVEGAKLYNNKYYKQ